MAAPLPQANIPAQEKSPWACQAVAALPRLLGNFCTDPSNPSLGQGDRRFWKWKLVDFGNGSFQGAAHGLAVLLKAGFLPEWLPENQILAWIRHMVQGARTLTRANGSLEEAFPHESSFCVTGLAAYDLLSALRWTGERMAGEARDELLSTVAPMLRFVVRNDETHGFITNHLAATTAACFLWNELGDPSDTLVLGRGQDLLERILGAQSQEGWFPEYGGADAGYMSLALGYLADLHTVRPDLGLAEPLTRAVEFLSHFAHPDGTFGGVYGCRNTRIFYPAGAAILAGGETTHGLAAGLDKAMGRSADAGNCVTLAAMDDLNLVPLFNQYARAALARTEPERAEPDSLPCEEAEPFVRHFPEAGLVAANQPDYYAVVSTHKGGAGCTVGKQGDHRLDSGPLYRDTKGRFWSGQSYNTNNTVNLEGSSLTIAAPLRRIDHQLPTPGRFLVLRFLNVTLMRSRWISEWIKRLLVKFLITGSKGAVATNTRTITLGSEFAVQDSLDKELDLKPVAPNTAVYATHMATSGFFQPGDKA